MNGEYHTWTIVQFNDATVEAVPTAWVVGDLCYWPPFTAEKLRACIRKSEPVITSWPAHPVKIFRNGTYDDYTKARLKAKLAEDTSNLDSDDVTQAQGSSARIKKKKLLSSSDESETSNLPSPPKMKRKMEKQDFRNKGKKAEALVTNTSLQETTSTSRCHMSQPTIRCQECNQLKNQFELLRDQYHFIRSLAQDILTEVRSLKLRNNDNGPIIESVFTMYENLKFPLNSLDDLMRFEGNLQNEEIFNLAVIELSRFGGSNTYDIVKRILSSLLSDDLSNQFSLIGRKGKKAFTGLTLARVVIRAVEKANISKSQKETEGAIQSWLKRAKERTSRKSAKYPVPYNEVNE